MYSQNQFYELKTVSETFLKKNTKTKTKKTTPNQTTKKPNKPNKTTVFWVGLFVWLFFLGEVFWFGLFVFFFSVPAVWGGHRIHLGNPWVGQSSESSHTAQRVFLSELCIDCSFLRIFASPSTNMPTVQTARDALCQWNRDQQVSTTSL